MSIPSQVSRTASEIFGSSGLILEDPGTLYGDRSGLVTATAVFKIPREKWQHADVGTYCNLNSPHPIFTFIGVEKFELSLQGPYAVIKCDYAGIQAQYSSSGTPPEYELIVGVSESPIATHPKFQSSIGGTPKAPQNGANFRNVDSNVKPANAKNISKTVAGFYFEVFDVTIGEKLNDLAGVSSYLEANMTFKKSWKMNRFPSSAEVNDVGTLANPPPPCPTVSAGRTWLNMGVSASHKRGFAYFWSQEWRLSGRRGWSTKIYNR